MSLAEPAGATAIRPAATSDLDALVALEKEAFSGDRLSRRSFRHLLRRGHARILVAETALRAGPDGEAPALGGYVLLLYRRGTSLARLYSIAVARSARGQGVAAKLVAAAEDAAAGEDCAAVRLEIRRDNTASQALFRRLGYRVFGTYEAYYEDAEDALRFEKRLAPEPPPSLARVPYYRQTLDFTCGPAALIMAMRALDPALTPDRRLELRLWRESTTIFMTAGHGGCGPEGLALAAHRRGFAVSVHVNGPGAFFTDSVRSPEKKQVMTLVHEDFLAELAEAAVPVRHETLNAAALERALAAGAVPLVLISLYRITRERTPHWVVVTGLDRRHVYVNDPWVDEGGGRSATDTVNLPIPRRDFDRMARYGRSGQRAVLLLYPPGGPNPTTQEPE
ncbi:GNAT family N-acetyltransferase/peptidase C39 family protein [Sediminicurvatus halobius]|uniref:Ribosomal-protein-alanine acetyltransferase n=1 Tax=Sediminicurvatus halobius TaxID=2182432 RepID=A0A2U2MW39_9GAMM|nr:GNAT family N-acetyltransferase/peptidase C39 family protein [Spiribacter halobius]PWG61081.1 ribosomal-protein-alanine acetyltransferase [Spiribacter halobius]UEX77107.1 GNAT family N-acetyltransferase/peptidase C39 family protein [Spiribacter halobius]